MARTLTALIAALTVTATLSAANAPALAGSAEATRGFLSSGHSSGISTGSLTTRGIAGGDLGSGR